MRDVHFPKDVYTANGHLCPPQPHVHESLVNPCTQSCVHENQNRDQSNNSWYKKGEK